MSKPCELIVGVSDLHRAIAWQLERLTRSPLERACERCNPHSIGCDFVRLCRELAYGVLASR